jgi:hypothetical protein
MRTICVVTRAGVVCVVARAGPVFFGAAGLPDPHADTSNPHIISIGMMTPTRPMRARFAETILASDSGYEILADKWYTPGTSRSASSVWPLVSSQVMAQRHIGRRRARLTMVSRHAK